MGYRTIEAFSTDAAFSDVGRSFTGTSYIEITIQEALIYCFQVSGDGTAVGTVTFETTNFDWASPSSSTTGDWQNEADVTAITIAAVAGSGGIRHVGNIGAPRCRLKFVMSVAGTVKVAAGAKV